MPLYTVTWSLALSFHLHHLHGYNESQYIGSAEPDPSQREVICCATLDPRSNLNNVCSHDFLISIEGFWLVKLITHKKHIKFIPTFQLVKLILNKKAIKTKSLVMGNSSDINVD